MVEDKMRASKRLLLYTSIDGIKKYNMVLSQTHPNVVCKIMLYTPSGLFKGIPDIYLKETENPSDWLIPKDNIDISHDPNEIIGKRFNTIQNSKNMPSENSIGEVIYLTDAVLVSDSSSPKYLPYVSVFVDNIVASAIYYDFNNEEQKDNQETDEN